MDQLTQSFRDLLSPLAPAFRSEVFSTFCLMTVAWIVCLGRRTISRVWETTGLSADHSHCPAFRLYSDAVWNWDELVRLGLVQLLALVSGSTIWLVVDDTLCHKRGARVAFGGIFLDPVLSSKKHKTLRYGVNWVTLGLVVQLPFRPDRFFCVNLLWRVYRKANGNNHPCHRTKPQLAREMIELLAGWLGEHQLVVVADCAYVGKHLLKGLPDNVCVVGPIHWKAALTTPVDHTSPKRWKKGEWTPNPTQWLENDDWPWKDLILAHPKGEKRLLVKVVQNVCWYNSVSLPTL